MKPFSANCREKVFLLGNDSPRRAGPRGSGLFYLSAKLSTMTDSARRNEMPETTFDPRIQEFPIVDVAAECDETLCEQVMRALFHANFVGLHEISVTVRDGRARLTGVVPTYYLKQLAQSAAASVKGVRQIDNYVCVR
jgi:osmotically-inducible protein OsmY